MKDWLQVLDDEDRMLVKRLVVFSGSLKAVARSYGVSYPTLRSRLDRVIAKIELWERPEDGAPELERLLALRHAEGRIDRQTFVELLDASRRAPR
jgi:hypothetical protein